MKLVVIESPYKGDVDRNLRYLDACIRDCLKRGESPYASHKMLTTALNDNVPEERALGIEAGLAWRDRADLRVFYIDLGYTEGMKIALARYREKQLSFEVRKLGETWVDYYGRCPHDGATCHHNCDVTPCFREKNGMSLSTPWPGYPRR